MCDEDQPSSLKETIAWSDVTPQREPNPGASELVTTGSVEQFLSHCRPFSQLPEEIHRQLAAEMIWREYSAGATVYRQGDLADGLLVIVDGAAEVVLGNESGTEQVLSCVYRGAVLGEVALLATDRRSANVRAVEPLRCLHWPIQQFRNMAASYPPLMPLLSNLVAERIGTAHIDSLCGKQIHGYRIRERLGRGAMAVVYLADEIGADREVALKMMSYALLFDHMSAIRFRREADMLVQLNHPHIIKVHERFLAFNTMFFAMEYCAGCSLGRLIRRVGALTENQVRPLLGQLAKGLRHLHTHDVIHRDLKPTNILVFPDGTLKLADFGLARPIGFSDVTDIRNVVGTPLYMAGEQLQGQPADAAADLFAFGCIVYELLLGKPPCQARDAPTLLTKRLCWSLPEQGELGCDISDELYTLLDRCLGEPPGRPADQLEHIESWAGPIDAALLRHVCKPQRPETTARSIESDE